MQTFRRAQLLAPRSYLRFRGDCSNTPVARQQDPDPAIPPPGLQHPLMDWSGKRLRREAGFSDLPRTSRYRSTEHSGQQDGLPLHPPILLLSPSDGKSRSRERRTAQQPRKLKDHDSHGQLGHRWSTRVRMQQHGRFDRRDADAAGQILLVTWKYHNQNDSLTQSRLLLGKKTQPSPPWSGLLLLLTLRALIPSYRQVI